MGHGAWGMGLIYSLAQDPLLQKLPLSSSPIGW